MSTFTFIANYKGGIYIRQVTAENLMSACYKWAEQIVSAQDIPKSNGEAFLQAFKEDIEACHLFRFKTHPMFGLSP